MDDLNNPRSSFIWDNSHSLYLGGDVDNPIFITALRTLIAGTVVSQGKARQLGVFKIYSASDAWAEQIPELLQRETLPIRERILFRFDPTTMTTQAPAAVPGFQLQPITRDLLADSGRVNAANVLEEIASCWTTVDQFYARGFGFCVVTDEGDIAGWCTAEYVSDQVCGVGIETIEAYQGQGVATMAARAFLQQCAAHGWMAHWDSWASNLPSIKVAQKAGFRQVTDYNVQIYVFDS